MYFALIKETTLKDRRSYILRAGSLHELIGLLEEKCRRSETENAASDDSLAARSAVSLEDLQSFQAGSQDRQIQCLFAAEGIEGLAKMLSMLYDLYLLSELDYFPEKGGTSALPFIKKLEELLLKFEEPDEFEKLFDELNASI